MKIKFLLLSFLVLNTFTINESRAFMFWNQACNFQGTPSSYVAFASSQVFANLTGSFTLEAWVHPFNSTSPTSQYIISKSSVIANGYSMRLSSGKVQIGTNLSIRVTGTTVLSSNKWTHICGTFDASTNTFRVYVDGVLDGSAIVSGATPISNTDSLRIGKTSSLFPSADSPFKGYIDEVRIWGKVLTSTEINRYKHTSLAAEGACTIGDGSGISPYCNLLFSLTFQEINSDGSDFTLRDWQSENIGRSTGVLVLDLSNRPSTTIHPNECVELDGISDYLLGANSFASSPTNEITMEAWIYPRSLSGIRTIIHKGPPAGGSGTNYSLRLNGNSLNAVINGNTSIMVTLPTWFTVGRWVHVAFTYEASGGKYEFFLNGIRYQGGVRNLGSIANDSEPFIIGGTGGSGSVYFDGYIDEVRIFCFVTSFQSINSSLYQSIDFLNDFGDDRNVVYNFDGNAYDNSPYAAPELTFYNNARFSHPGGISNTPISPIDRKDNLHFSDGFYLRTSGVRIPLIGLTGTIIDSFQIALDRVITDLNIYVGLNHDGESELKLTLIAPNNESVILYDNQSLLGSSDNIITIFDDQADSIVTDNGKFLSFGPSIKPRNLINPVFTGDHSNGWWKLRIDDETGTSTGRLYAWGIQINNMPSRIAAMSMAVSPQGYFRESPTFPKLEDQKDANLYLSKSDTMCFDLVTPSGLNVRSVCAKSDSTDGHTTVTLGEADSLLLDSSYYIIASHRNSIKVSTLNPQKFSDPLNPSLFYDFSIGSGTAYGNNLVRVGSNFPFKWAMYSGDVNQDCIVDLNDLSMIDNAAYNFVTGYVGEDITGDNFVDVTDLALADNNSSMFVSCVLP